MQLPIDKPWFMVLCSGCTRWAEWPSCFHFKLFYVSYVRSVVLRGVFAGLGAAGFAS